jgi:hypothetical protein
MRPAFQPELDQAADGFGEAEMGVIAGNDAFTELLLQRDCSDASPA